ncbi:hypothetical protein CTZ27_31365 [Streptomyces griseocarneus]|nr:hypothetical protein CTZ27_31365 [Streptomyces griseocarneus]
MGDGAGSDGAPQLGPARRRPPPRRPRPQPGGRGHLGRRSTSRRRTGPRPRRPRPHPGGPQGDSRRRARPRTAPRHGGHVVRLPRPATPRPRQPHLHRHRRHRPGRPHAGRSPTADQPHIRDVPSPHPPRRGPVHGRQGRPRQRVHPSRPHHHHPPALLPDRTHRTPGPGTRRRPATRRPGNHGGPGPARDPVVRPAPATVHLTEERGAAPSVGWGPCAYGRIYGVRRQARQGGAKGGGSPRSCTRRAPWCPTVDRQTFPSGVPVWWRPTCRPSPSLMCCGAAGESARADRRRVVAGPSGDGDVPRCMVAARRPHGRCGMRVGTAPQLFTARLPGGGVAVMDIRAGRGRWHHFNATAALLWHRLTEGAPLAQAVDGLTEAFVAQGADEGVVRAALAALADQLRELGLLGARCAAAPDPAVVTVLSTVPASTPMGAVDRVAGMVGMATSLILLRCAPIRASVAVARALARIPARPAMPGEADVLFASVRRAARCWPGKAACLEESLACYLAAVLRGRSVTWVIGARTAPAGAHAWNEVDELVIGQDAADRLWPYAPALRIGHRAE